MSYNDDEPPLITILVWIAIVILFILSILIAIYPRQVEKSGVYQEHSFYDICLVQPNIVYYPKFKYSTLACISGYSSVETCPNGECITASGKEAGKYLIACPYHIPLGSVVKIKGIGRFTCADRTAYWIQEKYGDTFDLWFGDDYEGAKEFGRKYLEVEVYN